MLNAQIFNKLYFTNILFISYKMADNDVCMQIGITFAILYLHPPGLAGFDSSDSGMVSMSGF